MSEEIVTKFKNYTLHCGHFRATLDEERISVARDDVKHSYGEWISFQGGEEVLQLIALLQQTHKEHVSLCQKK